MKTVNILGTEYTVKHGNEVDYPALVDADGYCDPYAKEIVIRNDRPKCLGDTPNIEAYNSYVIRHELVHAFLFESGMTDWGHDEQLVNWMANMLPRINVAVEAMDDMHTQSPSVRMNQIDFGMGITPCPHEALERAAESIAEHIKMQTRNQPFSEV